MLLLFDIDGTLLLGASEPHRAALLAALSAVYGIADPERQRVNAAGKTDSQIAREIALSCGIANLEFEAHLPALVSACTDVFERDCPASLVTHLAPGVAELLDGLASKDGVRLSLLTGNYERIARTKLERAGIGHHFPRGQGAFGSDAEQRELLGPIARARAGDSVAPYPREHTTIIGDTPLDIACARADGLQVIAIATGPYRAAALSEADAVVQDAYALSALLQQ
ncbi:MAG TPA: haloacid dehalogenase-like hydrolase [Solirubrobacteraceae bacterium]|nr:haloacid dehalogenase-like hydrolase [Solirubrobacteraceae bacterium]